MIVCDFGDLLALYHLEASITTEDFIQGLSHTFLIKTVLALHKTLLFARVENDDAWDFTFFKVKHGGELRFLTHIEPHEAKGYSTFNFASESCLDVVNGLEYQSVALCGRRYNVNYAKNTIFL